MWADGNDKDIGCSWREVASAKVVVQFSDKTKPMPTRSRSILGPNFIEYSLDFHGLP
jgi:hypothetical protein